MKKIKVLLSLTLAFMMAVVATIPTYAAEEGETVELSDEYFLDGWIQTGENSFENPETGEFFKMSDSRLRGTDKSFTFRIQHGVTSATFKLSGTKVKIHIDSVNFTTYAGAYISGSGSHKFYVNLQRDQGFLGWTSNVAHFSGAGVKDMGGGFSTTGSYRVHISNTDGLSGNTYLNGSGRIVSSK
jgi:hypothetical protein